MLDGSLSIDFDNAWAYRRAAGEQDWETSPSFLGIAAPRIVDVLDRCGLPLTVFVVGRDLDDDRDADVIRGLLDRPDVEAANHTVNHLPWLHTLAPEEVDAEIRGTHERLLALGRRPIGFRGPGFSCPPVVLRTLAELDYAYDASSFPTSIAPLARAVFLSRCKLTGPERERASAMYGGWSSALKSNRPHARDDGIDAEVPVTTMPLLRTPIHLSYLTFLAGHSVVVAKAYFNAAMTLCRITRTSPSLLLHPPDFLGCDDVTGLDGFPGMSLSRRDKLVFTGWVLDRFSRRFRVRTMGDFVAEHFSD